MARSKAPSGNGPLFEKAAGLPSDTPAPTVRPATPRKLGWMPVALVSGLVAAGLWGAWVTRNLLERTALPPMARVQLSGLVGEYVQAQARSATPPDQVTAETRAFMAVIQRNLEARGQAGQVVLVGEAVLAGDVPDITAELRRQVYAKVRMPQPAQAHAGDVMGAMRAAMADPRQMSAVPAGNPLHAPVN